MTLLYSQFWIARCRPEMTCQILHFKVCYRFIHGASGDVCRSTSSIQYFSVSVGNPYSGSFIACHNCLFHLTGWREREKAVFQKLCWIQRKWKRMANRSDVMTNRLLSFLKRLQSPPRTISLFFKVQLLSVVHSVSKSTNAHVVNKH